MTMPRWPPNYLREAYSPRIRPPIANIIIILLNREYSVPKKFYGTVEAGTNLLTKFKQRVFNKCPFFFLFLM